MAHPTIQPPEEPTPIDAAAARVGTRLNPAWALDEVLGVGGMATVFAATHTSGARAALKVLHAELSRDAELRERFLREGKIANCVDHPARVQVLGDEVSDRGEPFLVMELLVGSTLQRLLRRAGDTLPIEQLFPVLDTVLDLLERCHRAGIVHRDVKPANLFITADGQVKVLDFGLARARDRDAERRLTRSGQTYGTPAFMAPEQAMGLQNVDGRADLWSVGACLYTALSGRRLNHGRTDAESYLLAATQPAPSLARAAPHLPVEIVTFVDRALAFDRGRRFQSAAAMRAELRSLLMAHAAGRLAPGTLPRAPGVVVRANDVLEEGARTTTPGDGDGDGDGAAGAREEACQRVAAIWRQLAVVLGSARQYGFSHAYVTRGLGAVTEEVTRALAEDPAGLRWDVTPSAFTLSGQPVWHPDRPPFDRIPYQLFADGIRSIQLKPGITELELRDFAAILLRDRAVGGDEDSITALWDRRFEHIAYLAVDSFAEGDAAQREAFEQACGDLASGLLRIDGLWDEESLEGRAIQRNLEAMLRDSGPNVALAGGALDASSCAGLGAQLSTSLDHWRERFVDAFVEAYLDAVRRGDAVALLAALTEWTADQVVLHNLVLVFEMHAALRRAFAARGEGAALAGFRPAGEGAGRTEPRTWDALPGSVPGVHRALTAAMFPPTAIRAILEELITYGPDEGSTGASEEAAYARAGLTPPPPPVAPSIVEGLALALEAVPNGSLFGAACECYSVVQSERLREVLLGYLSRWVPGRELELAEILPRAPAPLALTLLRLLSTLRTPTAAAALDVALRSPHLEVRVRAIALLPDPAREGRTISDNPGSGQSVGAAERVREELQRLLEDPEPAARLEALRTIARIGLIAAGPTLVRHVQAPAFQERSVDERRAWLETVVRLNPTRAERLAIELLERRQLLPSEAHEQTREIAAAMLASFASTQEALIAAKEATKPRWGSSPAVRDAAARAVPAIAARLARRRSAEPAAEASPLSRRSSTLPPPASAPTPPPTSTGRSSVLPPHAAQAPALAPAAPAGRKT